MGGRELCEGSSKSDKMVRDLLKDFGFDVPVLPKTISPLSTQLLQQEQFKSAWRKENPHGGFQRKPVLTNRKTHK